MITINLANALIIAIAVFGICCAWDANAIHIITPFVSGFCIPLPPVRDPHVI